MYTADDTWVTLDRAGVTTAVVPIGALEQHGTNLPLRSDNLITELAAEAIARDLGAYLLPVLPIGASATHLSFRGTISLRHETLAAVIGDVVDSLARTGFTAVVLVSLHGGNYVLWSDLPERLSESHPGMRVVSLSPHAAWNAAVKAAGIATPGLHTDESEASLVAYVRPDLVGPEPTDCPDYAERLVQVPRTQTGFPQDVRQVSSSGALGTPSLGTVEKGERLWQAMLPLLLEDVRARLAGER